MDAAAHAPLHATLVARRSAIADRWYRAIADTGFAPLGGPVVRARLLALTDRAITALLAEPFAPEEARALGAALAGLHYLHPAALAGTLVVLGEALIADLPPGTLSALQPRLAALLGALAGGYYAAARDAILAEQEAARAPLLAEQQRVEAALRASEARYRAVVEQAAEGIFLFAAEGKRLVEANPAFLRLLGYDADDLPNLTLYDLVAHDRPSIDANTAHLICTGHHAIGERDYRRKDGAPVPVEVSATALAGAGGATLCVVVRDLTARRAAEARLREGDRRLRETLDHAPLILFTLDRAGVVTFARGQGLEALGLTTGQVVGHSVFIEGQEFPEVLDNVRRALAGEAFAAVVTTGKHHFSVHYAPLYDDADTIAGVIGVAANSTRRLRAEAMVRRYAVGLTPHEQEALTLLATDLTQRQIAARLCVGHETVRTHLRRIAAKLDLDTAGRAAVVGAAHEQGLLGTVGSNS
jgi:PAS domain S-box-containing protein